MLVFGCAYERIADEGCSDATLRRRRDEWIALGAMDELRDLVLEAYDRFVGLELSDTWPSTAASQRPHAVATRLVGAQQIGESGA